MGHTVSTQRQVVEGIIKELRDYGRSLRAEDQLAFERLIAKVQLHISNISFTSSYNAWAFVLFSIMLEQEKEKTREIL